MSTRNYNRIQWDENGYELHTRYALNMETLETLRNRKASIDAKYNELRKKYSEQFTLMNEIIKAHVELGEAERELISLKKVYGQPINSYEERIAKTPITPDFCNTAINCDLETLQPVEVAIYRKIDK